MLHPDLNCESILLTEDLVCKLTGFVTKEDAQERVTFEAQKVRNNAFCVAVNIKLITSLKHRLTSHGAIWQFIFLWNFLLSYLKLHIANLLFCKLMHSNCILLFDNNLREHCPFNTILLRHLQRAALLPSPMSGPVPSSSVRFSHMVGNFLSPWK